MPEPLNNRIISVAVALPLRQTFDFIRPEGTDKIVIGARIRVPFGTRKLVGIVVAIKAQSEYPKKLKSALQVLDTESVFEPDLWSTLHWLASYYLAPIGEVLDAALPLKLRRGAALSPAHKKVWRLSEFGQESALDNLQRAPLQQAIIRRFKSSESLNSEDFKEVSSGWHQAVKALLNKGWLTETEERPKLTSNLGVHIHATQSIADSESEFNLRVELNVAQQHAVNELTQRLENQSFSCNLIQGVTGSGKTEVYFSVMRRVLQLGRQVLFLVPEIGLTPQLIERVGQTFNCPTAIIHSGLKDSERHLAWWHSRQGDARIVIGTRSAVFTGFAKLGLIVVDEEHDASFKQQEGVRYQARDVAIYRAKKLGIPIILGSATPSLESYHNAQHKRYHSLRLEQRATKVALPNIELFDTRRLPCSDGLSPPMVEAISNTLETRKQVMLFLNKRGYAPVLYCKECGETSKCHRCDSHLTLHQRANRMRCHHCGYEGPTPIVCNSCQKPALVEVGEGTQRVEDALTLRFPAARILRIDRDSTRHKGKLAELLGQARDATADILLGTQLLTKGHDFPDVAMVGVLGADSGLYATDFRSSEVLFQQILQVAGRAGRRDVPGRVFIQTAFPNHPFFAWVRNHDFDGFAENLLAERKIAAYPPFGFFAMIRAESTRQHKALQFLRAAKATLTSNLLQQSSLLQQPGIKIMDAIPAPMERRAGRYRAQLLVCSQQRSSLNALLLSWLAKLRSNASNRKLIAAVRWSLDVDPFDHY